MTRRTIWLSLALTFIFSALFGTEAQANTIRAVDCTQANVASAVAQAVNGDTVAIPACSQTDWTTTLGVTKCIDIAGSGQGVTILGDNVAKNGSGSASQLIAFSVSCGSALFKLHDLTIVGVATDPNVFNKGHVSIAGSGTAGFRIYNITGTNLQTSFAATNWVGPGLFDHLNFPNCGGSKGEINMKSSSWGGGSFGDGSWSDPAPLPGSSNQIYIENSTWSCGGAAPSQVTDGDAGARWVFRFNTVLDGNAVDHGADTSQRERSGRWQEYYQNSFSFTSNETPAFIVWFRGGSGMEWGNSISAPGGLNNIAQATNCRDGSACASGYTPWGFCNGTGTWDQNLSGQSGYFCVDQPGAGTSHVVSGNPPSPAAWIGNISEPIYIFLNTGTRPSFGINASRSVQQDRDFYTDLNGSQGVRSGTFGNMPATCNVGQGYWATDQGFWNTKTPNVAAGQLYKCTSTNTWMLWYTPYTYPHPLTLNLAGPNPPTNVLVTVQ